MRLIDADKLIDDLSDLKRSPWANTPCASYQRKLGIIEALDMIQSIVRVDSQTVEAEPVTRCKECKHYYEKEWVVGGGSYTTCWYQTIANAQPNDFCSRAERKEE